MAAIPFYGCKQDSLWSLWWDMLSVTCECDLQVDYVQVQEITAIRATMNVFE